MPLSDLEKAYGFSGVPLSALEKEQYNFVINNASIFEIENFEIVQYLIPGFNLESFRVDLFQYRFAKYSKQLELFAAALDLDINDLNIEDKDNLYLNFIKLSNIA